MLPCIGSHCQTTGWPARRHGAQRARAERRVTAATPSRVMRVRRPGTRCRVQALADVDRLLGRGRRPSFTPTGLWTPRQELEVGAVELACPVAHPEHVRRAVVPVAGQRVAPGQRLLVVEQQRLVARQEVDLVEGVLRGEVDAAGAMKRRARSIASAMSSKRRPSWSVATNSWFQACTWPSSAKPPLVKARTRLSVAADCGRRRPSGRGRGPAAAGLGQRRRARCGPGTRRSPRRRTARSVTTRGLANWPAIRPTLTTGTPAP